MQQRLPELQEALYRTIPITRHMQFKVMSYDEQGIRLDAPLQENRNLFGTAFAGSLSTLAILSGWSMLWLLLEERNLQSDVVLQDNHCKYLLPVKDDFSAFCYKPEAAQIDKFEQTLKLKGRARLEVCAKILQGDALALSFQGRYVAQLK